MSLSKSLGRSVAIGLALGTGLLAVSAPLKASANRLFPQIRAEHQAMEKFTKELKVNVTYERGTVCGGDGWVVQVKVPRQKRVGPTEFATEYEVVKTYGVSGKNVMDSETCAE